MADRGSATIKGPACDLLCKIAERNEEGKTVGLPYDVIANRIRTRFGSNTSNRSLASYVQYIRNKKSGYEDWHGKLPDLRPRSGSTTDPAEGGSSLTTEELHMPRAALNIILNGPPGTGKTFEAESEAVKIIDADPPEDRTRTKIRFRELMKQERVQFVTFHQNYAYEDFIEGIRPVLDESQKGLRYELRDGIFKQIAKAASQCPNDNYVLIIDEINRGNIAKIFGELITLIEPSKRLRSRNGDGSPGREGVGSDELRATLPYSRDSFGVPDNLYLIGTMNTADRGIAPLDVALRRRFEFIPRMPNANHEGISDDVQGVDCRKLLQAINERIVENLDRDHQIGHTYFLHLRDLDELRRAFQTQVIPLLQEYFYNEWEKIDVVLNNNGFITRREGAERTVFDVLPPDCNRWRQAGSYKAIYDGNRSESDESP